MKKTMMIIGLLFIIVIAQNSFAQGAEDSVTPIAILGFEERGSGVKNYGEKVSDILFAQLVTDPNIHLVERSDIKNIFSEHELSLSGMTETSKAVQIGQLTGAKVLITGSVIEIDKTIYLVAKLIGVETSRVLGESVKGDISEGLGDLTEKLSQKVIEIIRHKREALIAEKTENKNHIASIQKKLGSAQRPTLMISISEHHVGRTTIDPAAETEIIKICRETGFEIIDPDSGSINQADILITGEGFSEFASRKGNMVSVKARLEIKAVHRLTKRIIATDRHTIMEIDLTEQIAGKTALQNAAANIAERLLPQLVKQ